MIKLLKQKNIIKKSPLHRVVFGFVFVVFFLYALSLIYPFVWAFISSLKNGAIEYFNSPFGLPEKLIFSNYGDAFKMLSANGVGFSTMIFNSLWFSFGSIIINISIVSLCAYVVARFKFPGAKLFYSLSVFIMMVPIYNSLPAQFRLYRMLHITNSPLLLITHTGVLGMTSFLIIHGFYKNLPTAYAEAAKIDGANDWHVYFRIMMPMARPILLSYMLINFIGNWNDYLTPILYLDKFPTLSSGLYTYQTIVQRSGNYPVYFAGIFVSILPILILYSLMHKTLVENMSFGGIKG